MPNAIYLKTLNEDYTSLTKWYGNVEYEVGEWVTVPGNGCYVSCPPHSNLFAAGCGKKIVLIECKNILSNRNVEISNVKRYRSVRVLRDISVEEIVQRWPLSLISLLEYDIISDIQMIKIVKSNIHLFTTSMLLNLISQYDSLNSNCRYKKVYKILIDELLGKVDVFRLDKGDSANILYAIQEITWK